MTLKQTALVTVTCPQCKGEGGRYNGPVLASHWDECFRCNGEGWVTVHSEPPKEFLSCSGSPDALKADAAERRYALLPPIGSEKMK